MFEIQISKLEELLKEFKKIVTKNLLFDSGRCGGGALEMSSKVLEQCMKKHSCRF